MVDEVISVARGGKPRDSGLTLASDCFGSIDDELLEETADYVDFVKIGLSLPLVVERSKLLKRVHRYHDLGIKVMNEGTLIEVAVHKDIVSKVLERLRALEFDMVEVSEFAGRVPIERKQEIANMVSRHSMESVFRVGSPDGSTTSREQMVSRIQEAFELSNNKKVIVEVPQEGRDSRPYGQREMSWDVLNEIAGTFGPPHLIFEAPLMFQRIALILEFGPSVNLSGVTMNDVLCLEMQRLGLTTETLGLSQPPQTIEGPPAAKFVYHLVRTEHPIDQATLNLRSGLPRRTVQAALRYLVDGGFVREVPDASDMRRRKYTAG